MEDQFRPKTPEELEQQKKEDDEFNRYLDQLINTGRQLLADERYSKFREIFEKAEHQGTELIINYENKNMQEFYCYVVRLQEKMKAIRLLIREAQSMVANPEAYKKNVGLKNWFMNVFKGSDG